MVDFFTGSDLWSNIIGGVVAAALINLYSFCVDRRKKRILKDLIEIMGRAIKHRNIGRNNLSANQIMWIEQAKTIETEATLKARELSPAAGSFIEWLDQIPPYDPNNDVEKYVSILSVVIKRIREIMERST